MRIVVVDDDPAVLNLLVHFLRDFGWTVAGALTFADGARLLDVGTDLMVADVRLGEFNGLYLALLAREANPNVRVLLISGFDDPVIRRDAAAMGADFMLKPFTLADFLAAVEQRWPILESVGPACASPGGDERTQ